MAVLVPPLPRQRISGTRLALALATCGTAVIVLGCMNFTYQDHGESVARIAEDGIICHEGTVHVGPGEKQTVYYPVAFAAKPNLEVSDLFDRVHVCGQCEDHFEVCNRSHFAATAHWRARGATVMPPAPAVTATLSLEHDKAAPDPLPAPGLPYEPVRVAP